MKLIVIAVLGVMLFTLLNGCSQTHFQQDYEVTWSEKNQAEIEKIETEIAGFSTTYFSDYFSFVGRDDHGWVVFAIDNNRQLSKGKYKAEHATFFYDGETGFRDIPGYGDYTPEKNLLRVIPDSEHFTFSKLGNQTVITSRSEDLELSVGKIRPVFQSFDFDASSSFGVAPANLKWGGRHFFGRVITEHLALPNFDLSTFASKLITSAVTNRQFHGLYLMTEDGEDIYLRAMSLKFDWMESPQAFGFYALKGQSYLLKNLSINITRRKQGPGLFLLPTEWSASWGEGGNNFLTITEVDNDVITNWVVGGFSMAFVEGMLSLDSGETKKVVGFAELILP